jgi:hypothetical protein
LSDIALCPDGLHAQYLPDGSNDSLIPKTYLPGLTPQPGA